MEPLRVAVRVRPVQPHDRSPVCVQTSQHSVACGGKQYRYAHVFGPASTQEEVYAACGEPLVDAVLDGTNACLFAFGPTGAGKSYSMLGAGGGSSQTGVLPRCAHSLLCRVLELKCSAEQELGCGNAAFEVRAQFLEVYKELCFDLLGAKGPGREPADSLQLRESAGTVYAANATEVKIGSERQLMRLVADASTKRATARTGVHAHSSRSHALLILVVERRWRDPQSKATTSQVARLTLCDLAGSEGMERAHGGHAEAAGVATNLGLLALGRCLRALVAQEPPPYRDSALTRLLQTGLGGGARTMMLACVSPVEEDLGPGATTLQYAQSAQTVLSKVAPAPVRSVAETDPMAFDEHDPDESQKKRCLTVPTPFGKVFCRCVGESTDPLLLYVHGSSSANSSRFWSQMVLDTHHLAQQQGLGTFFHVAIDCPGYGRSEGNRQAIRSYPAELLQAVLHAFGRQSAAALLGSSQGCCAIFNAVIDKPRLCNVLAACHPVGHAPQRYAQIEQPSLLIFDTEDAGHPVSVGRLMKRYLPCNHYFEFARSRDGDWEAHNMPRLFVSLLKEHQASLRGGRLSDKCADVSQLAGGVRGWLDQAQQGAAAGLRDGPECAPWFLDAELRLGPQDEPAPPARRDPALFAEPDDDDDVERAAERAKAARARAAYEAAQTACDSCGLGLVQPLRLQACRCLLCACCVEQTLRYTLRCPVCAAPSTEGKKALQQTCKAALAAVKGEGGQAARLQELADQRHASTRLIVEFGNEAQPQQGKTLFTTSVTVSIENGKLAKKVEVTKPIKRVDFNINPGYAKPTCSVQAGKGKFEFAYAMKREFPCETTVHFAPELEVPALVLQYVVQPRRARRRCVVEVTPGVRPGKPLAIGVDPPRDVWIRDREVFTIGAEPADGQNEYD